MHSQLAATAEPRYEADTSRPVLERIDVLDILRGIALVGMFIVHFNMYEATPAGAEPGRLAAFVESFLGMFIEERFWGIFGMLFGVGFAVQLTRAEARGEPFVARYLRRLAALAVFGFIAEGVFGYNVLFAIRVVGRAAAVPAQMAGESARRPAGALRVVAAALLGRAGGRGQQATRRPCPTPCGRAMQSGQPSARPGTR